ncbi:MAG: MOSC domain-containing protein, partial [Gammaproteobacteria bacterium]
MADRLVLSGLYRYPVKSLRGQACDRLILGPRGPLHDREWMVVDAGGRFLTQR